MRIASKVREKTLHDGKNQALMRLCDLPEKCFVFRKGPELGRALERPPAEHPPLYQIWMLLARLFDREIALIHGTVALRTEAHLLLERAALEHLHDLLLCFIVQCGI